MEFFRTAQWTNLSLSVFASIVKAQTAHIYGFELLREVFNNISICFKGRQSPFIIIISPAVNNTQSGLCEKLVTPPWFETLRHSLTVKFRYDWSVRAQNLAENFRAVAEKTSKIFIGLLIYIASYCWTLTNWTTQSPLQTKQHKLPCTKSNLNSRRDGKIVEQIPSPVCDALLPFVITLACQNMADKVPASGSVAYIKYARH